MASDPLHRPVLLQEALEGLALQPEGIYIDATFGRGGHAAAILERLGETGRLCVMDRDPAAIRAAQKLLGDDGRVLIRRGSFAMLQALTEEAGVAGQVNGVLFDLGVSSPQLDEAERGFSFLRDGPLDMRMDPDQGVSAAAWLADADEAGIRRVLKELGEERFAGRIARAIVAAREAGPLMRTGQLATLIEAAVPTREPGKHPATRTFQALRIHINDELAELDAGLAQSVEVLATGGRLVVISFHSLEDRIVKRFMRREEKGEEPPPEVPVRGEIHGRLRVLGKPRRAGEGELQTNPRARSAVMRVAERRP